MTEAHITPEAHSGLIGGSTARRRVMCPRSLVLEQRVPADDKGGPAAHEGTALHELIARVLTSGDEPSAFLPFTFKDEEQGWAFTVDPPLWDEKGAPALEVFDAYLDEIEAEHGGTVDFIVENRVQFPGIEGAFGTSDVIACVKATQGEHAGKTVVYIIDWKFGYRPVDAERNMQLMFYARGAYHSHTPFTGKLGPDSVVELAIIQPLAEDVISTCRLTGADLLEFQQQCVAAIEEGQKLGDQATIRYGGWCTYARCRTICPLLNKSAEDVANAMARLTAAQQQQPGTENVDFSALFASALPAVSMVRDWADAIEKYALKHAEAGVPIPGYDLVAKRQGARQWAVPGETVVKFFRNRKFSKNDFMVTSLITPTQAERLLKADGRDLPDHMAVRPPSTGNKLVPSAGGNQRVQPTTDAVAEVARRLSRLGGE